MFHTTYVYAARRRMLRSLVATGLLLGMLSPQGVALAALTPELAWIRQIGASATSTETARAVDDDGNTFIAGTTDGALSGETSAGGIDGWIRKYDRTGNVLFSRQFGTSGDDVVTALAINSAGIYVIGYTDGVFAGETAVGGVDIFARRYSQELEEAYTYVRQFGTTGDDYPLAADRDIGGIVIGGKTNGAFQGEVHEGGFDGFAMRMDTDMNMYWVDQIGSAEDDVVNSLEGNGANEVLVAGTTHGTLPGQENAGGSDAFWRLINVITGDAITTQQFGTTQNDEGNGAALMSAESAIVVGTTSGAFPGHANAGGTDAFVVSFDLQSGTDWTLQFGTNGNDTATGIGHAISERLAFVTGTTNGAFPGQSNAGGTDVFLRKLDTWNGATLWDTQLGTAFDDTGTAVALDNSLQHVFAVGHTHGTFAGQASGGGQDGFVMKYKQDNDGDGIYNEVDILPGNFTDEFSDATLHNGITSGTIVDRGDQSLMIEDSADSGTEGITIKAKNGGLAAPAEVSICQNLAQSLLDPGEEIDVTCGSAHIAVKNGLVDNTFIAPDGVTTTATFDSGNALAFDGYSALSAPAENIDPITVNIGATTQIIGPGATIRLVALLQDSFLREGKPNLNEGANPMLLVRKKGDVRSLVQFDLSSVNMSGLSKATLVLSIGGTPPANWGGQGNPIEVRRLLNAWTEGNGKDWNIPEAEATRGSGAGVTWKCPTDAAIENTEKDCSGNWEGGDTSTAARTAPAVTIRNGMSGEIRFDVTQDVLNGALHGWLVQKVNPNHPGNITFYSKEGASGAPALAPKLILEFQE